LAKVKKTELAWRDWFTVRNDTFTYQYYCTSKKMRWAGSQNETKNVVTDSRLVWSTMTRDGSGSGKKLKKSSAVYGKNA